MGNRGIYHDGWFAGTIHRAPWEAQPRRKLQDDIWELYDTRNDFSLVNDLAAPIRRSSRRCRTSSSKEAIKYRVLPIDDRSLERFNAATAGRPDLMGGRTSLTLFRGHGRHERERVHQHQEPLASRSPPTWTSRKAAPTA